MDFNRDFQPVPPDSALRRGGSACSRRRSGDAQATTEFVYRPSKKTQIDRGSAAAKTGDNAELGKWLMLGSGSGMLLLLLLLGTKRRNEEEGGEA